MFNTIKYPECQVLRGAQLSAPSGAIGRSVAAHRIEPLLCYISSFPKPQIQAVSVATLASVPPLQRSVALAMILRCNDFEMQYFALSVQFPSLWQRQGRTKQERA